jgi:hypothetical protein
VQDDKKNRILTELDGTEKYVQEDKKNKLRTELDGGAKR